MHWHLTLLFWPQPPNVLGEYVIIERLYCALNSCHEGSNIICIKQLPNQQLILDQVPKIKVNSLSKHKSIYGHS